MHTFIVLILGRKFLELWIVTPEGMACLLLALPLKLIYIYIYIYIYII